MQGNKENPSKMDNLISSIGNGVILGHVFGSFNPLYNLLFVTPSGSKFKGLISQWPRSVYSSTIQMTVWSAASSIVDPYIVPYISQGWFRSFVSGAATGAFLNCRTGINGAISGATFGALQSLPMSLFGHLTSIVVRPITEKRKRNFYKKRTETAFVTPINAMISAFNL